MLDLGRFRQGDHGYFREVLKKHGRVVRAVCMDYGDSEDEVDDLVQEVWTLVYEKRKKFRGSGRLSTWLFRVSVNHCIDAYRKKRAERRQLEAFVANDGALELHSKPSDPVAEYEQRCAKRALWEAVERLPEKEKEAVVARFLEGKTPTEVAEEMGIEKGSVRSNTSRAIRRLRGILGGGES